MIVALRTALSEAGDGDVDDPLVHSLQILVANPHALDLRAQQMHFLCGDGSICAGLR